MKISYAITVCNEFVEIQRLVSFLLQNKRYNDEIVILYDSSNGDEEIESYLRSHSVNSEFAWHSRNFDGHFADHKNYLSNLCNGDYIFQIDADEIPHESLIVGLPSILKNNPDNEVYLVPRVNTVDGLTEQHTMKWGWSVDDRGWINYPDFQWRIWKNIPEIKWTNKVHEVLRGFKSYATLPELEEFSLYHPKDIIRQEKQNDFYNSLV